MKRSRTAPPGFYAVEAAGLRWLAAAGGASVVEPLEATDDRIVLPRLTPVAPSPAAAESFGRALAATHRAGAAWFGAPPPGVSGSGFIGELPLPMTDGARPWGEFYAAARLRPYASGAWSAALEAICDRLAAGDESLTGPPEPPSRLHGDLWAGNAGRLEDATPVVYDPASYFGDREADVAMTELFGGFASSFYSAYADAAPLPSGYPRRRTLYNLYHVLNHLNLFGASYLLRAESMIAELLGD